MVCSKVVNGHSCFAPGFRIGFEFSRIPAHEVVFPGIKVLRIVADFKGSTAEILVYFFQGTVFCNGQGTDNGVVFVYVLFVLFLENKHDEGPLF